MPDYPDYVIEAVTTIKLLKGDAWRSPEHDRHYADAFANLGKNGCIAVGNYIANHCQWRPSRSEVLEIAARIASPVPTTEDALEEITWKIANVPGKAKWYRFEEREGGSTGCMVRCAKEVADSFCIDYDTAPDFTHICVTRAVGSLGKWSDVKEFPSAVLGKQFREAYERIVERWRIEVKEQLMLPAKDRNQGYFPNYMRFEPALPTPAAKQKAIAPAKKRDVQQLIRETAEKLAVPKM